MAQYFTVIVLVLSVLGGSVLTSTPVDECDDGSPLPLAVQINDCEEEPCPLRKGTTAAMVFNFTANEDIEAARITVIADVDGLKVPYPLPQPNVCKGLVNAECPLQKGQEVSFTTSMKISVLYPKVANLGLAFTITNTKTRDVVTCFQVNCEVVGQDD